MISVWKMQLLVQLYRLKTMKEVAKVMMISSAAVSNQLKELEIETNSTLFEKHGRNVSLTAAGIQLVNQVKPLLEQFEQINNSFKNNTKQIQGNIRIAAFDSAIRTILIPIIPKLKEKYPKVAISIAEQDSFYGLKGLNNKQFDLSIIATMNPDRFIQNNQQLKLIKIGVDALKVLVSKRNPLTRLKSVNALNLRDQNLILDSSKSYLFDHINSMFSAYNLTPNVFATVQNYPSLENCIEQNIAVGILPELAIIKPAQNISIVDLAPPVTRNIYLAVRKQQEANLTIQVLVNEIEQYAKSILNQPNQNDQATI